MAYYHLRITLLQTEDDKEGEQDFSELAQTIVDKFMKKTGKYIERSIYGYEYKYKSRCYGQPGDITHNHHIHGHIQFKPDWVKENVRYYLKTHHPAVYNFEEVKTTPERNELYVCKELRLIKGCGYTDEQIEQIRAREEEIEEDKKKDPKQKMIDVLKKKHKSLVKFTMNGLLEEIKRVYIINWDKFPPPQCKALCEYITVKELEEYKKNPRVKKNDLDLSETILVPPLMKSWVVHCDEQFRDNQCPEHLDWTE